jgi:hypothetical protein
MILLVLFLPLCLATSSVNVVERRVEDSLVVFEGVLFIGDTLNTIQVEYNTSSSTSIIPRRYVKSLPAYLYTFRMTNLAPITATLDSGIKYALVAPVNLPEFSLILGLYKTDFVFLGEAPNEIIPHLFPPQCTTPPPLADGLDFIGSINDISVTISHSVDRHTISSSSVCGQVNLIVSGQVVPVWIDCVTSLTGPSTVISGTRLNLGFYRSATKFCIYQANNEEIDHTMAFTLISILFIFLLVWADWTRFLWTRYTHNDLDHVWETITVAFSLFTYQVIAITIGMNIYATFQGNHNLYNFATMRMVSKTTVDNTAAFYSYGVAPILGFTCFITMVFGRLRFGPIYEPDTLKTLTWGFDTLKHHHLSIRILFTLSVMAASGGIIYGIWIVGMGDTNGAIASGVTLLPSIVHYSTPSWLTYHLRKIKDNHYPALLFYMAWAVCFMVITCICNNLPFDVSGQLNTVAHSGISFFMGSALLAVTGRNFANIILIIRKMPPLKYLLVLLYLGSLSVFVLWYVSIFNLGGMFSHSGALQNKGPLATVCSIAFSNFTFCISFSITVHNGISNLRLDKFK